MFLNEISVLGSIYDYWNSYDIGFYSMGILVIVSGLIRSAIPWILKRNEEHEDKCVNSGAGLANPVFVTKVDD